MSIPNSGQLKLRGNGDGTGVNEEVSGNVTDTNVSLHQLAIDAGFSTPDAMRDFYGYTSYEQPSISGTPSTSGVSDTRICVVSPTYSNPTGGNIERGFYLGTSTTATSNPWYSQGNSSSTSTSFNCNFTSLSGGTTYRIFAGLRDTCSPTRFTEAVSSMRTQSTQAAVSYTTCWGGAMGVEGQAADSVGTTLSGAVSTQYNHVYYGWTGLPGGFSCSLTSTIPTGTWEGIPYNNRSGYWAWRNDGNAVANRKCGCYQINVPASPYGGAGEVKVRHNPDKPNGSPAPAGGGGVFNNHVCDKSFTCNTNGCDGFQSVGSAPISGAFCADTNGGSSGCQRNGCGYVMTCL